MCVVSLKSKMSLFHILYCNLFLKDLGSSEKYHKIYSCFWIVQKLSNGLGHDHI